ncbi:MAG: phosphoribosylglycinamide formyltransferase [Clostridiales bacterium]|nr:phosphoribosylglycinamide formyltransferase [Clostridiales bacterium]
MLTKIAVLVSGGGTNLQALFDTGLENGEIVLVVSNRKAAYALERAKARGVETAVLSNYMEPDPAVRDEKLLDLLRSHGVEVVVLAGFLGILGEKTISAYENRIVNIHPALIPSFCGKGFYGLHVHEAVLERGVKITGATAHLVNLGVDEGPILLQKAVEVLPGDTPEVLQKRVMEEAEWKILPAAVDMICRQVKEEKQ